eukprot:4260041-Pleurochrysis_carterae.AAC.2
MIQSGDPTLNPTLAPPSTLESWWQLCTERACSRTARVSFKFHVYNMMRYIFAWLISAAAKCSLLRRSTKWVDLLAHTIL